MSEEKKQILVVDGERLGGVIAKMLTHQVYLADVANDGMKAVNMLRTLMPDLVIVEVDVPGNGIKLAELIGISPRYKDVPVILMSANPTPDIVIRAKNAGASSYLAKPFRPSDLQSRMDYALSTPANPAPPASESESKESADGDDPKAEDAGAKDETSENEDGKSSEISNRVRSIEGLPAFPTTHAQILEMANSDETSSDDMAEKLQLDPSLLATLFKLVNSSYYGFQKQVKDIQLAVTLLGLEEIGNLVMAAQVFEKLGNYEGGAGLDLQEFWMHSVGTAFIARAIAKKLNTEIDSAFLSGMLHDLGEIILDRYFTEYYETVFQIVEEEEISIGQAETEILGLNHAAIGGQLAEEWRFPKNYLNAILHHHHPKIAPRYQRLVCIVHIADVFCRELEFGSGGDSLVPDIDGNALERFSLGDRGLAILKEAAEEEIQDASSFLSALSS